MRGLRAITIGLSVGLWPASGFGAPPADEPAATPGPDAQTPARPVEYLRAGAALFNKGDFQKAKPYFDAAEKVRGQLSKNEQVVLDTYVEELGRFLQPPVRPPSDPAVAPASMTLGAAPAARPEPPAPDPSRYPSRYATTNPKQRARWYLQEARAFIRQGKLEEAGKKVAEADALKVEWGRFDDTPEKLTKAIEYARTHGVKAPRVPSARPLGIRLVEPAGRSPAEADAPGESAPAPRS
jgi:hypothetical protein